MRDIRMPHAIVGKESNDSKSKRLCFAYNMEGCSAAADGQECPKGRHICCEPGCGAAHTLHNHK